MLTLSRLILWDGTNVAAVKAASTAPAAADPALVVAVSPNSLAADNSPTTPRLPVMSARANAAAPTWTEGNQAPLSVDLAGNLRTSVGGWLGSTAPTVGQKTKAQSLPVTLASDQDAVPTTVAKAATATVTGKAANNASANLLAANTNRLAATVHNDSSSAKLYLKLGTTATAASGGYTTVLSPDSYYEVPPGYTGPIDGVWAAATGFCNVTELTP